MERVNARALFSNVLKSVISSWQTEFCIMWMSLAAAPAATVGRVALLRWTFSYCSEHFLLRWICLLFWTFFYCAERFLCAEHFLTALNIFNCAEFVCCFEHFFTVLNVFCALNIFMRCWFFLFWAFVVVMKNLCCIEHSHVVLNIFPFCPGACFSSASAASLQKNSANLCASSGKWCVMSHLSFKLASTATTTHNVENWINGLLKVVRDVSKLKPARSSLLVVELLKPLQSDDACSQSSTNRQSCSRRTPAELQGVFWSCKGVFHI